MDEAYNFLVNDIGISDSVVVACSGGPDSMALLSLVVKIKKEIGLNVIVAHINHNVRVESDSEKDFVYNYCKDNDLIFEFMKIDNYSSGNFESEARDKRYLFFDELVKKYDCKYVLTAHHGDDLMETILMRIVRGSSLKGYGGFSRVVSRNGYSILRPLIHMTKSEILEYDDSNGIKYVIDKTNFLDVHTRNRYRKYILPDLKNEDINVHDKFYKFSSLLYECDSFIDRYVDSVISDIFIDGVIYVDRFIELDRLICYRIIYRFLSYYYCNDIDLLCDRHVSMIYDCIFSSRPNVSISLPKGFVGVRSYNEFRIVKDNVIDSYDIEINDIVLLPNGKKIEMIKKTSLNDNNVIRLNSADVCMPLHVRTRVSGDRIHVKNMDFSKKVNDIFIDCKIPLHERDIWPIVVDYSGTIVWIPGLKKSKFDRINTDDCDIILRYY